jgi:hypothetical protein
VWVFLLGGVGGANAAVIVSSTQRYPPCCPYFVKEGDSPEDISLTGEAKKKSDFPATLLRMKYSSDQNGHIITMTAQTVHLQ